MKINIFVEGHDSNFIKKYIKHLFPEIDEDMFEVISIGGVTNLHNNKNSFEENSIINKGINLVIFDADDPSKDYGGFELRKKYLEDQKESIGIEFNYFLFPNNSIDGDYENLLEQIINPKHKVLFDCFELYQSCIDKRKYNNGQNIYNVPIRKTKIYAYVDSLRKSKKEDDRFKKRNKDIVRNEDDFLFDNPEFWDLNSDFLNPLKEFLTKHISMSI